MAITAILSGIYRVEITNGVSSTYLVKIVCINNPEKFLLLEESSLNILENTGLDSHEQMRALQIFQYYKEKILSDTKGDKQMNEIERKFLVKEVPVLEGLTAKHITQSYIKITQFEEERIRKTESEGVTSYERTVKTGSGIIREEKTTDLMPDEYEWFLEQAVATLTKIRYVIEEIGAELDIYPSGLVIVEVEFNSLEEAEAFTPPAWFGEEVTGNNQYSNAQLALAVI